MFLLVLIVSVLLWGESATRVWAQDEPLQGRVEEAGVAPTSNVAPRTIEPFPQPVLPKQEKKSMETGKVGSDMHEGATSENSLSGRVEESKSGLEVMEARPEP